MCNISTLKERLFNWSVIRNFSLKISLKLERIRWVLSLSPQVIVEKVPKWTERHDKILDFEFLRRCPFASGLHKNWELISFLSWEMPSELAQFISLGKSPRGLQSFLGIANLDICQVF